MAKEEVDRKTYLGGHDISALLGVNPYRTPLQVYAEKKGLSDPFQQNEYTWLGLALEPAARSWYRELNENVPVTEEVFVRHSDLSYLAGHPDGIVGGNRNMLEIKVVVSRGSKAGWGEPGTDQIPRHYLVQVAYYLMLTGLPYCDVVAVFIGDSKSVYRVYRSTPLEDLIQNRAQIFWDKNILQNEPPPVMDGNAAEQSRIIDKIYPIAAETVVQATPGMAELGYEWMGLEKQIKALEERRETIKAVLKAGLREASSVEGPFGKIAYPSVPGMVQYAKVVDDLATFFNMPPELVNQVKERHRGRAFRKLTPYWRD